MSLKTILITGKSTIITALLSRGYKAVDLDSEAFSTWVDAVADDDEVNYEIYAQLS